MITGGSLEDSKNALNLAESRGNVQKNNNTFCQNLSLWMFCFLHQSECSFCFVKEHFYCTVGCHPTHCCDFEQNCEAQYLSGLKDLAAKHRGKVVAVGECGLGMYCTCYTQENYLYFGCFPQDQAYPNQETVAV